MAALSVWASQLLLFMLMGTVTGFTLGRIWHNPAAPNTESITEPVDTPDETDIIDTPVAPVLTLVSRMNQAHPAATRPRLRLIHGEGQSAGDEVVFDQEAFNE